MKNKNFIFLCLFAALFVAFPFGTNAQRKSSRQKSGKICGNPNVKCRTGDLTFQPHEIPFEIPKGDNNVIVDSEPFYAVMLKTVKLSPKVNCENAVSETERLQIQEMFSNNKVFALKCSDAGDLYYTNIANNVNFIAVYAGKTLIEAENFLQTVQSSGKFKGANLRRMQATINGT